MGRRIIPPGVKEQVLAAMAGGKSCAEAAREFSVNESTARKWKGEGAPAVALESAGPVAQGVNGAALGAAAVPVMNPPAPAAAPLPPMAPAPNPITDTEPMTLEELRECQQILSDVMDYRRDLIAHTAENEGLNPNHPKIKELGERSRVGKLALNRGAKSVAPLLAKVPPWGWLIIGLVAEGASMVFAVVQVRKLGAELRAKSAPGNAPAAPAAPTVN